MNPAGFIIIAIGLFAITGAVMDWDWYMEHRKARLVVKFFGRNGARIFYAVVGALFCVMGALVLLNIVSR
ncbi:immunity 17 family protein [Candidatus Sumerlaeota bacterium]|nr:immunity 17 family protein [Candidatus Sumerlaeota bacterium]